MCLIEGIARFTVDLDLRALNHCGSGGNASKLASRSLFCRNFRRRFRRLSGELLRRGLHGGFLGVGGDLWWWSSALGSSESWSRVNGDSCRL